MTKEHILETISYKYYGEDAPLSYRLYSLSKLKDAVSLIKEYEMTSCRQQSALDGLNIYNMVVFDNGNTTSKERGWKYIAFHSVNKVNLEKLRKYIFN